MGNEECGLPERALALGIWDWYAALDSRDKVRLKKHLQNADMTSKVSFFMSLMRLSNQDSNYKLTKALGEHAIGLELSDVDRFNVNENLIEAYYNLADYDRCMACCDAGLGMMDSVRGSISLNGAIPNILCRNYKINVIVGIYGDYDRGFLTLNEFYSKGLIAEDELEHRMQSLKIHKLQRLFDGIYSKS